MVMKQRIRPGMADKVRFKPCPGTVIIQPRPNATVVVWGWTNMGTMGFVGSANEDHWLIENNNH